MEFVKQATTAVIERNGKILIAQRMRDDIWELPGGKIDPGETPEECVVREIKEELDIRVKITRPLGKFEGVYRDMQMELYGFLTEWVEREIAMNVHKDVKWIEPAEVRDYPFIEEDLVVFEAYRNDKKE